MRPAGWNTRLSTDAHRVVTGRARRPIMACPRDMRYFVCILVNGVKFAKMFSTSVQPQGSTSAKSKILAPNLRFATHMTPGMGLH